MTDKNDHNHTDSKHDTRRALYPDELPEHLKAELEKGFDGETTPELDHLMENDD